MMSDSNESTVYGKKLRARLIDLVRGLQPETRPEVHTGERRRVAQQIEAIDYLLGMDGEFVEMVLNASINFLCRELIVGGRMKWRRLSGPEKEPNSTALLPHIRTYTSQHFRLERVMEPEPFEKMLEVLTRAVEQSSRSRTNNSLKKAKKRMISAARMNGGAKCHFCGRELKLETSARSDSPDEGSRRGDDFAEVEHLWPRSLGGTDSHENLRLTCACCNRNKRDVIDASDSHFEHFVIGDDGENAATFRRMFTAANRVAALIHNNCRCTVCDAAASDAGTLYLDRREPDRTWSLMNVAAYCDKHRPVTAVDFTQAEETKTNG